MSQLAPSADDAVREPGRGGAQRTAESGENFPVAPRWLPGRLRRDLRAVYGVARAIDDLGDDATGDRTALLAEFETDLRRVWTAETPRAAVLVRLVPTVSQHGLTIEPFLSLIAANRLDQVQSGYQTWAELRDYCSLSADPVGHIVLALLGADTDDRRACSDEVCTALQLLEHCQDVSEDRARGRTYLPREDLVAYGVADTDLDATVTTPQVRALVAYEVDRAESMLRSGVPLVRSLRGAGRFAVAGYVAGGLATVDALRRADFDVLAVAAAPRRRDTARHVVGVLSGRS